MNLRGGIGFRLEKKGKKNPPEEKRMRGEEKRCFSGREGKRLPRKKRRKKWKRKNVPK